MNQSTKKPAPSPLRYQEIAGHLKKQIETGVLVPGGRLPSLAKLRSQHGITQFTVERAYTLLEKEGLIVRSHRSGVFVADPNQKPRTGLIGICGMSFTQTDFSAYWTRLMEGVENAAHECDAQIVLLNNNSPSGWDKLDGLLVNPMNARIPAKYLPSGLPIVSFFTAGMIDGTGSQKSTVGNNLSVVGSDDYAGARAATEHLVKLGHRRIAYLNNSRANSDFYTSRLIGYRDALRNAGVTPESSWLRQLIPASGASSALFFMSAGREAMRQWLLEDWKSLGCTALLAHNDDAAWGVVEALREAGIKVPADVSVVGFDGTEVAECCTPQLTTIEVPLREMGRAAVEMLQEKIGGDRQESTVVLPTRLHVRESTALCAGFR